MDPFIGEIRAFGFPFAPRGWALCNGALLPVRQYTALYSLIGTFYGGDGVSTFAVPNLQGSVAMGQGQGAPGRVGRVIGEIAGTPSVSLNTAQLPAHTHPLHARAAVSQGVDATGATLASGVWVQGTRYGPVQQYSTYPATAQTSTDATLPTGGSQAHNNMMPHLTFSFCIALTGVFPSRP